jgi:hypothetical protein
MSTSLFLIESVLCQCKPWASATCGIIETEPLEYIDQANCIISTAIGFRAKSQEGLRFLNDGLDCDYQRPQFIAGEKGIFLRLSC